MTETSFFSRYDSSARAAFAWLHRVFHRSRGGLTIVLLPAMVATLSAGLLTLQILLVGVLDRFGFAPQYGFLSLNLLLIATLTACTPHPLVRALRRSEQRTASTTGLPAIVTEPICKLLIVRRLTPENNRTRALQILRKRDNADEIPTRNWLRGS
ncbi:MAG TPA: hypothetical protein VF435_10715 [Pyrinomonadaceae bacterium]